jgi:hypothetical protein
VSWAGVRPALLRRTAPLVFVAVLMLLFGWFRGSCSVWATQGWWVWLLLLCRALVATAS